jgi:hypothetical protein
MPTTFDHLQSSPIREFAIAPTLSESSFTSALRVRGEWATLATLSGAGCRARTGVRRKGANGAALPVVGTSWGSPLRLFIAVQPETNVWQYGPDAGFSPAITVNEAFYESGDCTGAIYRATIPARVTFAMALTGATYVLPVVLEPSPVTARSRRTGAAGLCAAVATAPAFVTALSGAVTPEAPVAR